jgi:cell division protease FtsH
MAEDVIDEHREGLVQLAELLLEREVVFTEDVENIFGKRSKEGEEQKLEENSSENSVEE